MQKILIIEDDPVIRDELSLLLTNEGYSPRYAPDLILLDINLPGQDGFSLCAKLRKLIQAPIIFVTSRDSGLDEVRALSLGGDDYITKPYSIPVLLTRIKVVLRRMGRTAAPSDIMEYGGLRLNLTKGTVSAKTRIKLKTETAVLTRNELQILACLMAHAGEIVSRTDLIETLWDNQIYIEDNTLSVNITRLRGKLARLGFPDFIKTRRGMGYQL